MKIGVTVQQITMMNMDMRKLMKMMNIMLMMRKMKMTMKVVRIQKGFCSH